MKLLVLLLLPCLSLGEVMTVPGFGKCRKFFLGNEPPEFTPLQGTAPATVPPQWFTSVQEICQCVWDEIDQKRYLYATLYNTDWKIPIYSAYVFRSARVDRKDYWYIEPQLDGHNNMPCMTRERDIKDNGDNQAVNGNYVGSPNVGYHKGHLYPVRHTDNALSMRATSTLTNAAPQDSGFNMGAWRVHEEAVIKDLKNCTVAYVVTGVVPDHNKPKLNNRVTVSKYYWRATCCLKSNVYTGKAYFGPDPDNNNVVNDTLTITALQAQLTIDYDVNNIVIFPGVPPQGAQVGGCS